MIQNETIKIEIITDPQRKYYDENVKIIIQLSKMMKNKDNIFKGEYELKLLKLLINGKILFFNTLKPQL